MKKRIVIKVGSSIVTEQNRIAKERLEALVELIAQLQVNYEVILVSSGAVAAGYTEIKLDKSKVQNKQALAAIGQPILLYKYRKKFEAFNRIVSQVLITAKNFENSEHRSNMRTTIETLLEHDVIPIINENDAIIIDELIVGDNDQLSAFVAHYCHAELLVILSDIDAYYDKDPNQHCDANWLREVNAISEAALNAEVSPNSHFATGGIVTKLKAANFMMQHQKKMFLASGMNLSTARTFLLEGRQIGGTLFCVKEEPCA